MGKHYAISDIHGMYNIYEQVCAMLKPEDIVYFLGDAGDRGYACFKCIKDIYNNPQWNYLKGNHEDMMEQAIRQMVNGETWGYDHNYHQLWMYNGGFETENEWMTDGGADTMWMERLHHLPLQATYTNEKGITFHMSHAGFTPDSRGTWAWGDELLWNRTHFYNKWDEEKYPNDIVIHGHTPIEIMVEKLQAYEATPNYIKGTPEARVYCNGHKINIDNGVFYTGATVLYDLDEMKAIPLYDEKFQKGEWRY